MKNTMKKLVLLFAVMLMAMLFVVSASAATEGCYTYEVENSEATITVVDKSISGDIVIPSTLGGYPVTTIGWGAFEDCDDLTSVTIPDSVTSIGDGAFAECESLTNVTIPDSVTSIGCGTFLYCTSITSITIPDSVTSIGSETFLYCTSLTGVTIPDSVTSIGEGAFLFCYSLTSIKIPDGVTSIGRIAFGECTSLTSITIPDSITSIGEGAFGACTSLTSITVDGNNKYYSNDSDGVLFNKDKTKLIQYPAGNTSSSYIIPDSVTNIDSGAFVECTSLTSITIPDSVISIGDFAFDECSSLTDVYYIGSQSQWSEILVDSHNDCLLNANIHFGSCSVNSDGKHSYTSETITAPTHFTEGMQKLTCACGDSYTEPVTKTKEHIYTAYDTVAPTCEDKGYTVYACECGSTKKADYTDKTGHTYEGLNCKICNKKCSCNCHKKGISNFFWKIGNFFNKLFKINSKQFCACGVAHY